MSGRNAKQDAVRATDFVRNFSDYARRAELAPVYISQHARINVALCSAAVASSHGSTFHDPDVARLNAKLDTILDAVPTHVMLLDDKGLMLRANRAARQHLELGDRDVRGTMLTKLANNSNLAMLERVATRVRATGMMETFEMASQWYERSRFIVTVRPFDGGTGIFVDDTTTTHELLSAEEQGLATDLAIDQLGIAQGEINTEGRIVRVSDTLSQMMARDADRMIAVRISTLFDPTTRDAIDHAWQSCVRDRLACKTPAALLSADGVRPVRIAFAIIAGPVVATGARFLIAPTD